MYSRTASGTRYRIDRPRATRSRIMLAETSMAGASTTRVIAGWRGRDAPGRAQTTTSASPGSASTSNQLDRSRAASAPSSKANRFPGSRSANARSVRTVYDGAGRSSSMRSTRNRGFPVTARPSIPARCSGAARCTARLKGCSRAGRNRTASCKASPTASATTRCPMCTGSKDPPNRASTRASGRARRARVGRGAGTTAVEPVRPRKEPPQVGTGFLQLVRVADGAVAVGQPQQRVAHLRGPRIARDHVLEVDDRRVVGPPPEIKHPGLVGLFGEPLLQLSHVQLRPRRGLAVGIAPGELLVDREGRLAVRGVQVRAPPQPQVRVPRPQQSERRVRTVRILVGHLAELVRRLHPIASLEVALGEVVAHFGHLRLCRAELEGEALERHRGMREVTVAKLPPGPRELRLRIRRARPGRRVVTGHECEHSDGPAALPDRHGPAFPSALILSWSRCAIVSPGAPPTIACW